MRLYLSNHGMGDYENLYFVVTLDEKQVFGDSVKNQYLSFHWLEKDLSVKRGDHNLQVVVSNDDFKLEKDTLISVLDSVKVFVKLNFQPYHKRYRNPDLYTFFEGKIENFKEQADSLYTNGLVPNAADYLNDTIPLPENLSIVIKQ